MSVSQIVFGADAVKVRSTRSSWTGGPGFLPLRPFLVPKQLHHRLAAQIRHTVRSQPPLADGSNLISQQPVAELRVVGVGVEDARWPGRPGRVRGHRPGRRASGSRAGGRAEAPGTSP